MADLVVNGTVRYMGRRGQALFNLCGVGMLQVRVDIRCRYNKRIKGRIDCANARIKSLEDECKLLEYAIMHTNVLGNDNTTASCDYFYSDERAYRAVCRRILDKYSGIATVYVRR